MVNNHANQSIYIESSCAVPRELLLIIVIYRPSFKDIEKLLMSVSALTDKIGYALVINDYKTTVNIEELKKSADFCLLNSINLGYGVAINRLVEKISYLPQFIGILNQDLFWDINTFELTLSWLKANEDVCLAVPRIVDSQRSIQRLCKRNPTFLALFSRRFLPYWIKPMWLKNYDQWYTMSDHDYNQIFEVEYLSGCCMLVRSETYCRVGGFDENYFLYLEDADLTRKMKSLGRCINLPIASVCHGWGRGNYQKIRLTVVNLFSAWIYFRKWGISFW